MELTTHQKTVKYTVYCLVIAVAGLLQNTPGLFWQIGSARCFLLLPVTLLLVMGERELPAALLGLFAGCVWDLHAAKSAGFNALFFMLLCFGVSAVMERYIRSTFVTHMLFALPARPSCTVCCTGCALFSLRAWTAAQTPCSPFTYPVPCTQRWLPPFFGYAAAPAPAAEPQGPAITGIL